MKAYNFGCQCGLQTDMIIRENSDVVRCPKSGCSAIMSKISGPIGGSNILPLSVMEQDRFIPFNSKTLGRKISTNVEMAAAYEELYGIKVADSRLIIPSTSPVVSDLPVIDEDDEDEDVVDDEDDDLEEVPVTRKRGRPAKSAA